MKNLFLLFLFLSSAISAQEIYIQNSVINVVDLVDTPTLDSVAVTPDSSDVFFNVTVRAYRRTYVPKLDSVVTVIDTLPFLYVLKSELDAAFYNAIWQAEARFAEAEARLFSEAEVETNLVKLNPVLIQLRGKGYLAFNRDRYIPQYVGYWSLRYNGTRRDFRIRANATIVEVRGAAGPDGPIVRPKPGGLTGTVQVYHGDRRLVLVGLIPGEAALKVNSASERSGLFVRRERNVEFRYRSADIQRIPFIE